MERLEERVHAMLRQRGLRIAVAESCTGGLICGRITNMAGASDYFEAGIITYSNKAKEQFVDVPHELIASKGAVSPETARAMAEGVRKTIGVDMGVSVTGIAGPGGGTVEKPVGTVFMALSTAERSVVRQHLFTGDRMAIRDKAANEALRLIVDYLEGRAD